MATIELIDVSVTYPDGTRALDHVSLTVPEDKVTAVLGPSGSGKSTALKVIGGRVEATEGQVLIGGRDVTAVPPERMSGSASECAASRRPNGGNASRGCCRP